jgi:hypothetical protein
MHHTQAPCIGRGTMRGLPHRWWVSRCRCLARTGTASMLEVRARPSDRGRTRVWPSPLSRGEASCCSPFRVQVAFAWVDYHEELVAHVELPVAFSPAPAAAARSSPGPRPPHPNRPPSARGWPCDTADLAQAAAGVPRGLRHFTDQAASVAPGSVWSRAGARAAVTLSEATIPVDTIRKQFGARVEPRDACRHRRS